MNITSTTKKYNIELSEDEIKMLYAVVGSILGMNELREFTDKLFNLIEQQFPEVDAYNLAKKYNIIQNLRVV